MSKSMYKNIVDRVHAPLMKKIKEVGLFALDKQITSKNYYDQKEVHSKVDSDIENSLTDFIGSTWPGKFGIVSEEFVNESIEKRFYFFIDPIDGTRNYIAGNPLYAVSVGLWDLEASKPLMGLVYMPMTNQFYNWRIGSKPMLNGQVIQLSTTQDLNKSIIGASFLRDSLDYESNWIRMEKYYSDLGEVIYGYRMLQSDAVSLCWAASGQLDGVLLPATRSFDIAGGLAILIAAGGKVVDLQSVMGDIDLKTKDHCIFAANNKLFDKAKKHLKQISLK